MMNVLQIQDDLKNFSEEQLIKEMQQPSGNAPQFLVLSELNRRRRVKGEFAARQAQKAPTVAEEAIAAAGVPQAGMMGMSEAMAPASVDSGGIGSMMPKTMRMGGEVDEYAEGGVIKAQTGLSIADRNYNPGNMRLTNKPYFGTTGKASGYATFASPEFGLRGIALTADKYAKDPKIKTLKDFVEKYSPAADDNPNNKQYAEFLAGSLGVGVDDEIDFSDDNVKRNLIPAITRFEGYKGPIDSNMVDRAITASKVTEDESKVNELLSGVDSLGQKTLTYNAAPMQSGMMSAMASTNNQSTSNAQSSSKVPKGVRPDFNINSVPKNIREKKYLEQLKKEQMIGKQDKRPILSDIIQKEIEKQKKDPKPSIIEEKTKPIGFPPFLDPYAQDRDKQIRGLEGRSNQDVYSDGYGIFTDVDPLENIQSPKMKENIVKELIKQDKMPKIKKIGGSDKAIQKEKLEKLGPSQESLDAIDDEKAIIGSDIPLVYDLQSQVTDTGTKKEKPAAPKADTTALTSLEQELLNRQKQLQKDRDFDRYMALAQAGLSIMSSDKPTLAGAIGEGGTAGLTAFREAQKRYQEGLNDILNARVKLASKKGGLTQKDAISAISSIDSDIAKYRTEMAKAIDPANVKTIENAIAQLEFQKERLLPIAGFSRLSMNVSDSAAK